MSRTTAPQMGIVKSEDKEAKLKDFIRTHLDTSAGADEILVIARSLESPVAKAIASLAADNALDRPVRAIFANVLPSPTSETEMQVFSGDAALRHARDVRLMDAHEQLVLGPATSWTGDCMRRDPAKRDAYECFAADSAEAAGWARISFGRMWNASEPATLPPVVIPAAEVAAAAGDDPLESSSRT